MQKKTSFTDCNHPRLSILPNKTQILYNKTVVSCKATTLKQQISKFYPQIQSTEASFYIYDRPLTDMNVIASV